MYVQPSRQRDSVALSGTPDTGAPSHPNGPIIRPAGGAWRWWPRLAAFVLALAALVIAAPPAQATEFRSGDAVTVPAGTTVDDDLFIMGQSITIAGQVNGEVFAFGQSIAVTGAVQRDVIAAGQQVTVDGTVGGDLRAAGQQVTVNGRVDGNVTAAGQTVLVARQGAVGGSVLGAGETLSVLGPVERNLTVGAGTLALGSTVGGDVDAHVNTITVDPGARVTGRLDYTSSRESAIPASVAAGGVQFHLEEHPERAQERPRENPFAGLGVFLGLVWLAGSIILGVLLVHYLPGFAVGTAAQVQEHPLPSFGIGLLTLCVAPAALFFLALTLVGLPIAFLGGLAYLAGLLLGWLLLGLALGAWLVLLARRGRADLPTIDPRWLVVLGLVVLYVVTHLPFIGGLVWFVALCLGLGALLRQLAALRPQQPPPLQPPLPV
jgi:cytoskeletal protein CcmA (bactofilin family)